MLPVLLPDDSRYQSNVCGLWVGRGNGFRVRGGHGAFGGCDVFQDKERGDRSAGLAGTTMILLAEYLHTSCRA